MNPTPTSNVAAALPSTAAAKAPAVKKPVAAKVAPKPAAKKVVAKPLAPSAPPQKAATPKRQKPATKAAEKSAPKPAAKPPKVKKQKMVRDSFTMPKAEFAVIETLKERAAAMKVPTKKTEMIRAGIKALAAMSDASFLAAVRAVPNLKTGRPAKGE
jgi:hypothetical protein